MRFDLNSGQTSAVNTSHGLGGDTLVPPQSPQECKGSTTVTEWTSPDHGVTPYWVAAGQNTAQVALEAGNSPWMAFPNSRELVRPADAEKWFGVAPEAVEAVKKQRSEASSQRPANVLDMPRTKAAA